MESIVSTDPFAGFKRTQREGWSLFAPLEVVTTAPAARLVAYARVRAGQRVLDAACGTGVVAVTAARAGAIVSALDLTSDLIVYGRQHAALAGVDILFKEGDVETLPYEDASFDVVLSQFGHMFAPRSDVATAEMLRVLAPGGTIAFSTWPPGRFVGQMLALVDRYAPAPPGVSPPARWGDPDVVRHRLGEAVSDIVFDRSVLEVPALSPPHYRRDTERSLGPVVRLVASLRRQPAKLMAFRVEFDALVGRHFANNVVRHDYLMTRAVKRFARTPRPRRVGSPATEVRSRM